MFGLMELTVQLDESAKLAIIPTFVIPFTILVMILTSLATWIAALFGLKLKAEGPKRLFEVLMKPKILLLAIASNALFYGVYQSGRYLTNSSMPLWLIELRNNAAGKQDRKSTIYADFISEKVSFGERNLFELPRAIKNIEVVWQHDLKYPVFGGMVASGDSLFMGNDGGMLVELDANTGKMLREIWIGQPVMTMPIVIEGHIYFGEGVHDTHHARYYNFDLASGKMNSTLATKGHIERKAAVAEINAKPVLLVPAGSDGVYAVEAATMVKLWQANIGHVDSSPVSDGERVFVGTGLDKGFDQTGTKAVAIDLKTGLTLWQKNLATSAWGIPILWKDLVCFSVGDVYQNTEYGQLACYNRATGNEELSINTGGALISQPVIVGDRLVVSDLHGVIYQLNLTEKKIDWRIKVPSKGFNYASVYVDSEDRIFFPASDGLYIYSRKNQEQLHHWKPESWKKPFTNITVYKDLWILSDGKGLTRALRPVF